MTRTGGKEISTQSRARRTSLGLLMTAVIITAITSGITAGQRPHGVDDDEHEDGRTYAIGLWGDLPYSPIQATVGVPNLIADMNRQELAFTVHDGDLKAGSGSPCDNALYAQALGYLNALKAPAMFTPGDNDWTDCDRPANGGFSSLERLEYQRKTFFSTPLSFGQHRMRQEVQTDPLCLGLSGFVPCVENRRWTVGRVTYATMKVTVDARSREVFAYQAQIVPGNRTAVPVP